MPLDPTVAFIFATLFLALVASLLYAYWYQSLKHRSRHSNGGGSQSLKVSELEDLVRKSVEEATASLDDRLASLQVDMQALKTALEAETGRKQLDSKRETLLDLPDDELADASMSRSRQRTRST